MISSGFNALLLLVVLALAGSASALTEMMASGRSVVRTTDGQLLATSAAMSLSEVYAGIIGDSSVCNICTSSNSFTCGSAITYCQSGSLCSTTTENNIGCFLNGACGPSCTNSTDCLAGQSCFVNTCCGHPVCISNTCFATQSPTKLPTSRPSGPTPAPSTKPSSKPSFKPTLKPSSVPTIKPSLAPSITLAPTVPSTCGVCTAANSYTCYGPQTQCSSSNTYCSLTIEKNASCFITGSCPSFTCSSSAQCAVGEACFPNTCCNRPVCLKVGCPGPTAAPTSRPSGPTNYPTRYPTYIYPTYAPHNTPTRYPTYGYPTHTPTHAPSSSPTSATCGVCTKDNTFECKKPATYCSSSGNICALTTEDKVSCMVDQPCGSSTCKSSSDCGNGEACFTNTCCGTPMCAPIGCLPEN